MRRLDYIGITFVLAAITFSLWGLRGIQTNTEDVLQWLPEHSTARADYNFFEKKFGSDDYVIVTWENCTLTDPRLPRFTKEIRENDPQQLIQSVVTGLEISERLGGRLEMSQASITRRLKGIFFGAENADQTCAFIQLSLAGTMDRALAMQFLWHTVDAVPQLKRDQVTMGGYPFVATSIDGQLKNSLRYFLGPSILLATIVALCCLRHLALTLIVFVTAVGAAIVSLAFVPMSGAKFGGLMSIIPALVFVLTTSGSIHLVRYSLEVQGNPRKLFSIGWMPCTISTLTTAVGMLSLTRSDFPAIQKFGFFCAAGVGFSLSFQLVMVPWLISRFGKTGIQKLAARNEKSRFWEELVNWLGKYRLIIVSASLLLMVAGGSGLLRLRAEVEVEKLFRRNSPILKSLSELEERMGPVDQTEVLLTFVDPDPDTFPARVNQVQRLQFELMRLSQVEFAHSLINYLPKEPDKSSARSFAKRSAYRSLLRRERENLGHSSFLSIDENSETWRISLKFPFTKASDFDQMAHDVEAVTTAVTNDPNKDPSWQPVNLVYTGKTYLFHHAQRTLLRDLFQNFLLAFVIITPILIIVLRSIRLGLIAMLPNLLPTLIVFGGLGWMALPVDLAIAMTASVALGIAVDDTTHFLIRFRDFGGSLNNVSEPVQATMHQCGPAMLHTTLIGCAGLMVYYFGEMLVVSKFALAISSLLLIALLADVIMLPAILCLFIGSKQGRQKRVDDRLEPPSKDKHQRTLEHSAAKHVGSGIRQNS